MSEEEDKMQKEHEEEMEEEMEEDQGSSSTKRMRTMHEQEPSTAHRELDDDDECPTEEEDVGLSVAIDQIMDVGDFSRGDVIDALDEFDGDVNAAYIVLQSTESMLQEEEGFTSVDQLMDAGVFHVSTSSLR